MTGKRTVLPHLIITLLIGCSAVLPHAYGADKARAQDEVNVSQTTTVSMSGLLIDPAALKILKDMSDTLSSAKEFTFDTEVTFDELLPSGQKIQFGGMVKTAVKRPGSVYAEFTGDLAKRKIWYSDKKVTILDENENFYGQLSVPGNIDETMDFLMANYDFSLPLADIMHSDPYESFTGGMEDGVLVGVSDVRGVGCSHLAFVGEHVDWQIWIASEEPPLPCKLVITYKNIQGGPQYEALFSNWNLSPVLSDSVFKPNLPEDAGKIDFIKIKKNKGGKK